MTTTFLQSDVCKKQNFQPEMALLLGRELLLLSRNGRGRTGEQSDRERSGSDGPAVVVDRGIV